MVLRVINLFPYIKKATLVSVTLKLSKIKGIDPVFHASFGDEHIATCSSPHYPRKSIFYQIIRSYDLVEKYFLEDVARAINSYPSTCDIPGHGHFRYP